MRPARSSLAPAAWARLCLLLAALGALAPAAGHAQDAAPGAGSGGSEDAASDGEEGGEGSGEAADEVDPRTKALEEEARRERIERQTTITSSLPTESDFLTSFTIPEGLIGERGIRYGRMVVLPAAAFGLAYTDNVQADDENREDDLSVNGAGILRVQSLLARHAFGADATITSNQSFQQENDDYFDWQVGGDGRLDLTRRSSVSGRVDYSRDTEDDTSADGNGNANDIETINGVAGYNYGGNRISFLADVGVDRANFSGDGSADRDRTTYRTTQRITHRTTPRLSLFVSPQYAYTTFDEDIAADGESRDSQAVTGLVGADFAFRSPLTLSGAVGYSHLFFEDSDQEDTGSLVANVSAAYQYDPLTNLALSASHSLDLTTVDDAAARTDTALALSASRQIGLNTSLQSTLNTTYGDFKEIDRSDIDVSIGIGLARRLTDHFFATLAYQYQRRFSDDDNAEFYENQALLGFSVVY